MKIRKTKTVYKSSTDWKPILKYSTKKKKNCVLTKDEKESNVYKV